MSGGQGSSLGALVAGLSGSGSRRRETAWLSAALLITRHIPRKHTVSPGRLVPADRQAAAQVLKDLGKRLASGRGVIHSFPIRRGSRGWAWLHKSTRWDEASR
jgi:Ser/Thr protein kinase RdoA (MazF antagonist)